MKMLFRFLELGISAEYDDWDYKNTKYLCSIEVDETYDRFRKMLEDCINKTIILKDEWYIIHDIVPQFRGTKDDLFTVEVFVSEYM